MLAGAAEVNFGDRDGQSVPSPGFTNQSEVTCDSVVEHPDCFDIGVGMPRVSTNQSGRIELDALVQKSLAGEIVVDSYDVRNARSLDQAFEHLSFGAVLQQVTPQEVSFVDTTGEQVEGEPPTLILEDCLVCPSRGCVTLAEVFCLNELRLQIDTAERGHG